METAKIIYQSDLVTEATHLFSGTTIKTDAPLDNNGKGSAFSPTDILSSSLASCMITIMAIKAEKQHLKLGRIEASVTKIMGTAPRRVTEIQIGLRFFSKFSTEEKAMLEDAALNCPVAKSLHPDIVQNVTFTYPE